MTRLDRSALTPPSPPLSGGEATLPAPGEGVRSGSVPQGPAATEPGPRAPSPDKGRVGEGLRSGGNNPDLSFLPYDPKLTELARKNRKNPSPAETLLWQKVLRHRQFAHLKFLRQKPIGHYIVDFYCAQLKLAIEVDGDSHAAQAAYDARRTAELTRFGIRVIRYTNLDLMQNLAGVFDDLCRHTGSAS